MTRLTLIPLTALGLVTAGCSVPSGPNPGPGQGRVNLSMASATNEAGNGPAQAGESISLGGTVLVFQEVELVLREIELTRLDGFSCDNRGNRGSSGSSDSTETGSQDDCEELEIGPQLVSLSLDGRSEQVVSAAVDTGTFRRLEFEIHKPDDDTQADQQFLLEHPQMNRISIRARGTWNGSPFVFTTDLNAEQRFELIPPITVRAGQTTELVLMVNLRDWFLNLAGTAFVNPETANKGGSNENIVKNNIRLSIEALGQL